VFIRVPPEESRVDFDASAQHLRAAVGSINRPISWTRSSSSIREVSKEPKFKDFSYILGSRKAVLRSLDALKRQKEGLLR
jgi:hypothetical protein